VELKDRAMQKNEFRISFFGWLAVQITSPLNQLSRSWTRSGAFRLTVGRLESASLIPPQTTPLAASVL
jgi:hypothetical protein